MIRVLVADDSVMTRVVLKDLLSKDPGIAVVGEARDGREAVAETLRLRPALVIMDVLMPEMDGLEATVEIMARCPTPILMLSSHVDPADLTSAFAAIQNGALDVMEKPQGVVTDAFEEIAAQLVEKIRVLARIPVMHHFRRPPPKAVQPPPAPRTEPGVRGILAIGASTGGPRAVMHLLRQLPGDFPARVVIVQHIATGFAANFADWLDRESPLSVRLARDGELLEEGVALVAPNETHLAVRRGRVVLLAAPPVNSCRPSVDVLFESLAEGSGEEVVALLLTGIGRDGARGMAALHAAGGYTIAQDQESCAIFGMPKAAIDLGVVDQVLPLPEIPSALGRLFPVAGKGL